MKPPQKLRFESVVRSKIKNGYIDIGDPKVFAESLVNEAYKAEVNTISLECLQGWIREIKKSTDEFNTKEGGSTAAPPTGTSK